MKIRRIEMAGFKSFADRTSLIFSEGLSGVVGPNGCGKSNVVDAVRWCLGEQSAKSMRGSMMQDVIFSGTQKRNAINHAEVSIVFGPGDTPFKGDYALREEIQITRKLERDGASNYFINKQRVRLKDINDLFLDSGLSNHQYSFIEQGQIGDIVNARPAQTRELIEEAAGVSRYQIRRAEALERLKGVDENLSQVHRMVLEKDRRIRTVAKQVSSAWLHRCYQSKIGQLSCAINLGGYAHEVAARRQLSGQHKEASSTEESIQRKLAQQISLLYQVRSSETLLQKSVNDIRNHLGELESEKREKLAHSDAAFAENKSIQSQKLEVLSRIKNLNETQKENRTMHSKRSEEQNVLVLELQKLRLELERANQEYSEISQHIHKIDAQRLVLHQEQQTLIRLEQRQDGLIQQANLNLAQLEREEKSHFEVLKEINEARVLAEAEAQSQSQTRSLALEQIETLKSQLTTLNERRDEIMLVIKQYKGSQRDQEHDLRRKQRLMSSLMGEADGLKRLQGRHEGISSDIKPALKHPSCLGVLAEHLKVSSEEESWVSALLGPHLDALICQTSEDAKHLLELCQGHVYIVILDGLKPCVSPILKGVCRDRTAELVLNALLPEFSVEMTLRDAIRLKGTTWVDGTETFVLGTNQLVSGERASSALEFMARARDIEELQMKIDAKAVESQKIEDLLSQIIGSLKETERSQTEILASLDTLKKNIQKISTTIEKCDNRIGIIHSENERRAHRKYKSDSRLEKIIEDRSVAKEQHFLAQKERSAAVETKESKMLQIKKLDEKRNEELAHARASSESKTQCQEEVNRKDKSFAAVNQHLHFLQEQFENNKQHIVQHEADISRFRQRASQLSETVEKSNLRVEAIRKEQGQIQTQYEEESRKLDVLREKITLFDEKNTTLQNQKESASEVRIRYEVQLESTREKIKNHKMVLQNEFEIDAPVLLGKIERDGALQFPPSGRLLDEELPDEMTEYRISMHVTQSMLDRAENLDKWRAEVEGFEKSKIDLGEVNHMAVSEHQSLLNERETISVQHQDLSDSANRIRETISKLNRECIVRFGETYERVNAQFQKVYPRLVGGGHAELELCDPNDLLHTGVEIYAQPPGKRLQSLKPLSGGEKAMVAISFLFSLFRVKPSPFCLLDEVDAPLDEGNGARFNAMLVEMSEHSQFIIITHNKKTMEVMDTLYGVTMPNQGVSKIVSVELN